MQDDEPIRSRQAGKVNPNLAFARFGGTNRAQPVLHAQS
jgi:hypothetical protein